LSCRSANNRSTPDTVFDGIWDGIKGRQVQRVKERRTHGDPAVGVMTYWNGNNPASEVPDLLKTGDGNCNAWQRFLLDLAQTHGDLDIHGVQLKPNKDLFAGVVAQKDATLGILDLTIADNHMVDPEGGCIPAQGNANPKAKRFLLHQINGHDSKSYDPSYGTGPFDLVNDWEKDSLSFIFGQNATEDFVKMKAQNQGNQLTTPFKSER
jgi:hypothetical protein